MGPVRRPFELEVEVMSRAMPILQVIPEMSILELLILLTGYTMDLEKLASLSFLHDNHPTSGIFWW